MATREWIGHPTGGVTLPANNGASAAEVNLQTVAIPTLLIGVVVTPRRNSRVAPARSAADGKTYVQGTQYLDLPADSPARIPVEGMTDGVWKLYLCSDDTTESTFSWAPIYGPRT